MALVSLFLQIWACAVCLGLFGSQQVFEILEHLSYNLVVSITYQGVVQFVRQYDLILLSGRNKKYRVLGHPCDNKQRHWSDWMDVFADISWNFISCGLHNSKITRPRSTLTRASSYILMIIDTVHKNL